MLNLLNMSVWEYLRENVILTVALAVILALIVALSGVMIHLQLKIKKAESEKQKPPTPAEEKAEELAAQQEEAQQKEAQQEEAQQEETDNRETAEFTTSEEGQKPQEEAAKTEKTPAPAQPKRQTSQASRAKKEVKKKEEEPSIGFHDGKWIIRKNAQGKFTFKLYAANGGVMIDSNKEYASLSSAKNGIETYKKNLEDNNCRIVSTKAGHFVYRLSNANGMLLAVSSNYSSKSSCENALELTKRYALNAPLEILTD